MINSSDIPDPDVKAWFQSEKIPIDKYATVRNYMLPKEKPVINKSETVNKICLIYCVWGTKYYLDMMYISLTSFFKYTDATVDIKLFCSEDLVKTARETIGNFPVEIISVNEKFTKYSIFLNDFSMYKKIILCDCDTYFYGDKLKLCEAIELSPYKIYMMPDLETDVMKVLKSRRVLNYNVSSEEDYLSKIDLSMSPLGIQEIIDKSWFLSCITVFDPTIFGNDWESHVNHFREMQSYCDETVFLTYFWKHKIEIHNIENILSGIHLVYAEQSYNFFRNPSGLGIVHPLHGTFCNDLRIRNLYNAILKPNMVEIENLTKIQKISNCFDFSRYNVHIVPDICHFSHSAYWFESLQTYKEINAAMNAIDKYIKSPQIALEIGLAGGGTHFLLKQKCTKVISIDLCWSGVLANGFMYEKLGILDNSIFVFGNSTEEKTLNKINKILDGSKVDVLFIDGGHDYNSVIQDHYLYSQVVRDGGLIFFHDYFFENDVKRAVDEITKNKELFIIHEDVGDHCSTGQGIAYYIK